MPEAKTRGRRFAERLDNFGAIAFTGVSLLSALGTGSPVIQLAAVALMPGAHIGVRTMLRSITGTPQPPMKPLMRFYSVGAAAIMTPLVNFPSWFSAAGPATVVAAVGGAAMLYSAIEATSPKALAGKPGRGPASPGNSPAVGAPDMEVASQFDLSADNRVRTEPRREFRIPAPAPVRAVNAAAPQGVPGVPTASRAPRPDAAASIRVDVDTARPRSIEDLKAALRDGLESRLSRRDPERANEKVASPRMS